MKRYLAAAILVLGLSALEGCDTLLGVSKGEPESSDGPLSPSLPYDMIVQGAPGLNLTGLEGGYYLWATGKTWHLRVGRRNFPGRTAPYDYFTGTIAMTGGYLTALQPTSNLQPPDDTTNTREAIAFRMQSMGEVKGIDFTVHPIQTQYCLDFDLRLNNSAHPSNIHLGSGMAPPAESPLRICFRHP